MGSVKTRTTALMTGLFLRRIDRLQLAESVSCMPTLMGAGITTSPRTRGVGPTTIDWIFQGKREPSRGRTRSRYWPGSSARANEPSSAVVAVRRARQARVGGVRRRSRTGDRRARGRQDLHDGLGERPPVGHRRRSPTRPRAARRRSPRRSSSLPSPPTAAGRRPSRRSTRPSGARRPGSRPAAGAPSTSTPPCAGRSWCSRCAANSKFGGNALPVRSVMSVAVK